MRARHVRLVYESVRFVLLFACICAFVPAVTDGWFTFCTRLNEKAMLHPMADRKR
jgi:hypothetical protein